MRNDSTLRTVRQSAASICFALLLLSGAMLLLARPVRASTCQNQWVSRNGYTCYYGENGKKLTGLQKIESQTYLFDRKGRQKTGWQKYQGAYYYFQMRNGKKGYMLKKTTINHITLLKSGKAKLKTAAAQKRMSVLIQAAAIVEQVSRPGWKRAEKMKAAWAYLQKNYLYKGSLKFIRSENWEVDYAHETFRTHMGNCYALGATWAFLANACGCEGFEAVSSGGHGWAEWKGRVYDPSWEREDKRNNYYGMDINLSGINGRLQFKGNGIYRKKI